MVWSNPPLSRRSTGRHLCLYTIFAVFVVLILFVWTPLPHGYAAHRDEIVHHVTDVIPQPSSGTSHPYSSAVSYHSAYPTSNPKSKFAYATFLAGEGAKKEEKDINDDEYFVATRILAYQLMYAPETRSRHGYPFIVLVTSAVSEAKRERLRRDGAIVIEAAPIDAGWVVQTINAAWNSVLSKFRLWELTDYERVAFVDGDTILVKPLDDIFNDPSVVEKKTLNRDGGIRDDEGKLPASYVFAGQPEMQRTHHYPPTDENHDYPNINYLNAGFFVLKPDKTILDYYLSLMHTKPDENGKHRFVPSFIEQNLLNYAHRRDGNMPWAQLETHWNVHYPTQADVKGGVATLHDKWWSPIHKEMGPYLLSWRWRMQGFFEARDGFHA